MRPRLPDSLLTRPIAHRAFHNRAEGRPENSFPAIRAAIIAGYAIEIDLQLTRDGVPVVFHDEALDRLTTTKGWIKDLTLDAVRGLTLRDCAEPVPTLAEVLALVGDQAPLLIELKDQTWAMAPSDGRLEAATAAALQGHQGEVALMSFNPHAVAHLARLAPDRPRGLTTSAWVAADWAPIPPRRCDELRPIPDYDRCLASFVSHEAADLDRPRLAELKAEGAAILCWTVKSPAEEAMARNVAQNVTFEGYSAPFLFPAS